jgi:hypothetical protein
MGNCFSSLHRVTIDVPPCRSRTQSSTGEAGQPRCGMCLGEVESGLKIKKKSPKFDPGLEISDFNFF